MQYRRPHLYRYGMVAPASRVTGKALSGCGSHCCPSPFVVVHSTVNTTSLRQLCVQSRWRKKIWTLRAYDGAALGHPTFAADSAGGGSRERLLLLSGRCTAAQVAVLACPKHLAIRTWVASAIRLTRERGHPTRSDQQRPSPVSSSRRTAVRPRESDLYSSRDQHHTLYARCSLQSSL